MLTCPWALLNGQPSRCAVPGVRPSLGARPLREQNADLYCRTRLGLEAWPIGRRVENFQLAIEGDDMDQYAWEVLEDDRLPMSPDVWVWRGAQSAWVSWAAVAVGAGSALRFLAISSVRLAQAQQCG